ncbi:MAG: hypothetical protein HYU88_09145 [Chloroflexi bacterium]|nr:hypothetical protein [Chloroflexota bacterium]MBI4506850.1 hypothetical protein [Chloroflexota bacterium]
MRQRGLLALAIGGWLVALGLWSSAADAQPGGARVFLPHLTRGFAERSFLANGDFEAGPAGWEPTCGCITSAGPPDGWHSGQAGARLGDAAGQRLRQTIRVPSTTGALRFAFWYQYRSDVPDPFPLPDHFTVTVRDALTGQVAYWQQAQARSGLTAVWRRESADLAAWQGRTLLIEFEALSPSGRTWLFLDDVELVGGSARPAASSPTATPAQPPAGPEPTPPAGTP